MLQQLVALGVDLLIAINLITVDLIFQEQQMVLNARFAMINTILKLINILILVQVGMLTDAH